MKFLNGEDSDEEELPSKPESKKVINKPEPKREVSPVPAPSSPSSSPSSFSSSELSGLFSLKAID